MNAHSGGPTLPWEGKAQRADKVLVSMIMLSGIYGFATMPLIPWMLKSHPLLLAAVRGGMASIVNLGAMARVGEVSLVVAIFVGLPATIMFDWVFWWAGARWGERSLHMILGNNRRTEVRLVKVKRWTDKYGAFAVLTAYYLPVPSVLIFAAAGWAGMSLLTFLILDVISALLWIGLLTALGYGMGQTAVDAVNKFGDYSLYVTIALVVVVIGRQIWTTRRQVIAAHQATAAEAAAQAANPTAPGPAL
jgi:membrane protein DedA with SNARE-associated domain